MSSKKIVLGLSSACLILAAWFVYTKVVRENPAQYYVDFDASMQFDAQKHYNFEGWNRDVYIICKQVYEKNNLAKVFFHKEPLIPKIIHQIWLGSPVPQEYYALQKTWLDNHPTWEYKLWTDKEVKELLNNPEFFTPELKGYYNEAVNYGEKSDILKWLLIYHYGGLYTDIPDYECLKPLDLFHHCYDFYTGVQPLDTSMVQLGAALFAARPHHPILEHCIETLRDDRDKPQIVVKTGPIHFTRSFCIVAPQYNGPAVALPASYFYPRGYYDPLDKRSLWLRPESFAVHHWAGSWLKKEAFVH